jgi:protein O-GlcNAc transferase
VNDGDNLLERGLDHHRSGNFADAAKCYRTFLLDNPGHPHGLYLSGCLEYQTGNNAAAIDLLRQAVNAAPRKGDYHNALGCAFTRLEKFEEAERSLERAIALDNRAEFHSSLGTLRKRQNRLPEAIAAYQESLRLDSNAADTHYNLGNAFRANGDTEEALQSFRQALQLNAGHFHSLASLGQMMHVAGRHADAAEYFKKSLAIQPQDADLLCDFGDLLQETGNLADAVASYQRALQMNPRLPRAWYSGGCVEISRREYFSAMLCFEKAIELQPDWLEARHNLARALYELGQVSAALAHFRVCAAQPQESSAQAWAMIAVIIPGVPEADNQAVLEARTRWAERDLARRPTGAEPSPRAANGRRLRIGYVSSFFPRDNWMKPVWGLINRHDRGVVEVNLFSDAPLTSLKHGYRSHPEDRFFDTTNLSNQALAGLIREAGMDVLIDLNGYSNMRRLPLFTLRPAPIAIGWFNMYATTGIAGFDYLIGDEQVIPVEEERFYSEKILRVPGSYLTFEVNYPVPPVADPPCLTKAGVTFGSLASQYKITNEVIASWSRILQQTPNSTLILKNAHLASAASRQFVHGVFAKHGIGPQQVLLEGPEEHYEFLQAYDRIDIALDTFPYNGGTTTTEAIWQGVPVIAFHGDRWASRTSASILLASGLAEFVARDLEDYVALAVRWGSSPDSGDRLRDLRRSMRSRLSASSVCDTTRFAREMEGHFCKCAKFKRMDQIKLAMANTNDLFNNEVFRNRNFAALDQIYTVDASILPPGAPLVSGRRAIKEFWSNLIQSVNAKSAVLTSVDVIPSGDGIVEIGSAKLTIEPEGQGPTELELKYVVYWRQEDARWKWHVDIWNQNS